MYTAALKLDKIPQFRSGKKKGKKRRKQTGTQKGRIFKSHALGFHPLHVV